MSATVYEYYSSDNYQRTCFGDDSEALNFAKGRWGAIKNSPLNTQVIVMEGKHCF